MPTDIRNSSNDGRDDWLSGSGEFDWGDEPSGPGRPIGTRTGARPPAADEPLWPDTRPAGHADAATIMRRRILWLSVGGAIVVVLIAVFALGGNDSNNTPTTAVTTPVQPTTTATTPKTQTTPKTNTTPAATTLTLPPDGEAMQVGSTGPEVLALQQALRTLGLDPGAADGDFGAATANAVGEFQRAHNLGDDGVVGAATIQALNTALAAEASAGA